VKLDRGEERRKKMAARARQLLQDTAVWRTLIAGSTTIAVLAGTSSKPEPIDNKKVPSTSSCRLQRSADSRGSLNIIRPWSLFSPTVSRLEEQQSSSAQNYDDNHPELREDGVSNSTTTSRKRRSNRKVYDFIVIGYGNAGRSAVETLRKECPSASIALLDPLRRPALLRRQQQPAYSYQLDYFNARVVGLTPLQHGVETDTGGDCDEDLQYRYAVLIASGNRGAVPPSYLLDDKSRDHIFELRPTILPLQKEKEEDTRNHHHHHQRPVLSAENVRNEILQRAKHGASVGVLGSGFEAIDTVVEASLVGTANHKTMKRNRPVIIFGSHGPVNHVLPNYLCSALAKKLKSKRIEVLDRSLIRYISHNDADSKNSKQQAFLNVYTAKSFDFLDGKSTSLDALVIAPETSSARGTGCIPTDCVPVFLEDTAKSRSWYQTWSALSVDTQHCDPAMLVCYKDDGRIAVTPELCACSGVYAAGSVAKYANSITGHATVAGMGVEDGTAAGRTAALNMARLYHHHHAAQNPFWSKSSSSSSSSATNFFGFGSSSSTTRDEQARDEEVLRRTVVKDPLPVWRSDLRYSSKRGQNTEPTSLSEIGVVALCVGNCEAESMATHGVWWTNLSAFQRRMTRRATAQNGDEGDQEKSSEDGRLKKQRHRQKREIKKSLKPVYGLGVVYYLDSTGRIQGVMTWGLPFTESENSTKLNQQLVDQMKTVIRTNGGIRTLDTEGDHMKMAQYLRETSQQLLLTALQSHGDDFSKGHNLSHNNVPRPLHRYTEVRPPSLRSVGVLKRRDGLHGHGVLGEDMFARFEDDETPDPPPPRPQPSGNVGSAAQEAAQYEARYNWCVRVLLRFRNVSLYDLHLDTCSRAFRLLYCMLFSLFTVGACGTRKSGVGTRTKRGRGLPKRSPCGFARETRRGTFRRGNAWRLLTRMPWVGNTTTVVWFVTTGYSC